MSASAFADAAAPAAPAPAPEAPARAPPSRYVRVSAALAALSVLSALGLGGYALELLSERSDLYSESGAVAVAAIFAGIAVSLSLHDVHLHLSHYVSPLQRFYVRILWMVPVYAVQSWLALRFPKARVYLASARECYEAYVLYSFFQLMLGFLGGRRSLAARLRLRALRPVEGDANSGSEFLAHLPPCSWVCRRGWRAGSRFVHRSAVGVYTYVLLRLLCTVAVFIAELAHHFKEEWSDPVFAITSIVINLAQFWALYALALFYVRLRAELAPMRPVAKFAVIKAVVFVSWWQGIAINSAVTLGLVPHFGGYKPAEVALRMQDFAICIEMAVAALAHAAVFAYGDFDRESGESPAAKMLKQQLDLSAALRAERDAAAARRAAEIAAAPDGVPGGAVPVGAGAAAPDLKQLHRARSARFASGMAAAAAPLSASDGIDELDTQGAEEGWTRELDLRPLGVRAAVFDMLPGDVLAETQGHLQTGFGLTTKWEKRATAKRRAIAEWARKELAAVPGVSGDDNGAGRDRRQEGGGLDGGSGGGGEGGARKSGNPRSSGGSEMAQVAVEVRATSAPASAQTPPQPPPERAAQQPKPSAAVVAAGDGVPDLPRAKPRSLRR